MKELLNYELIQVGDYTLKVSSVFALFIAFALFFLVLKIVKRTIYRASKFDAARKYSLYSLIKYFSLVITIFISLQILGINLSVLIAGSAALLVGIGLGLQNIFSDFISGITLLIDSSVKVDDIIEVNGIVCRVQKINLRTTTVLTRDDKYIILPNTELTKNQLINWTHTSIDSRFEVNIGVDYSSNIHLVMEIIKDVALSHPEVNKSPVPFVRFSDYGESALIFTLFFFSTEVFRAENIKSEIRINLFDKFKENNINIPFPQVDLHIRK